MRVAVAGTYSDQLMAFGPLTKTTNRSATYETAGKALIALLEQPADAA
jgi:hypothetical protein